MKDKRIIFDISVVTFVTVQASDFNILFRNWKPAIVL